MINLILPIIDNEVAYQKMLDDFSKIEDVKIYCGIKQNLKEKINVPSNVSVKIYANRSKKEEIINSLHSIKKEEGGIIVARRPLSIEEFESLKASNADIVTLQKPKNKFAQFWTNLWKKIIKAVFAFFYFEDISAIYFKENVYKLVTSLGNLSYVTRIDRFVGFEQETIASTVRPPQKEYDMFINTAQLILSMLFVVLCVLWSVIFCTSGGNIVVMILLSVLLILVGLLTLFISFLSFMRANFVGKLDFGRAEEV